VWSVPPSKRGNNNGRHFWGSLSSSTSTESDLDCRVLNNPCDDVMDVCWSKDSKRFVLCSLDHCVLVYEDLNHGVQGEGSKWSCVMRNAKDHLSYVQGVAYDPLGVYVASQGSDRTVRIFSRKPCSLKKRGAGTNDTANTDVEESEAQRVLRRQAQTQKMLTDKKFEVLTKSRVLKYRNTEGSSSITMKSTESVNNVHVTNANATKQLAKHYLFADESTVESFFRRLAWTADGAFLITPAALYHADGDDTLKSRKGDEKVEDSSTPSFATYLFARHHFDKPFKVFAGLEKPSVVVRPNPVLFKLPKNAATQKIQPTQPYRSIFAVLTIDCVLLYDTYHDAPLAMAQSLHYSGLTDCSWSNDGRYLLVTSTDGYISMLSFENGELGEVYETSSNYSMPTGVDGNQDVEVAANKTNISDPLRDGQLLDHKEEVTLLVPSSPSQQPQSQKECVHFEVTKGTNSPCQKAKKRITPTLVTVDPSTSKTIFNHTHDEPEKPGSGTTQPVVVSESTDEEGDRGENRSLLALSGAKRTASKMTEGETEANANTSPVRKDISCEGVGGQEDGGESKQQQQILQPKKKKRIQPTLVSCK